MKKTALALILALSLVFVFASLPQIGIVNAESIIYIRDDGSVEGTDNIQRDGNSYIFTGNITGKIVLAKSDVTINGNGFTLTGYDGNPGFYLHRVNNSRIMDVRITGCDKGFDVLSSLNISITGNTLTGNNVGIYVSKSQKILIAENELLSNDGDAVSIWSTNKCDVSNNVINSNSFGIGMYYSSDTLIVENSIINNKKTGIYSQSSENEIISDNIMRNNEEHGIRLTLNPKDYYLSGNEITNNGLNGVCIEWAVNATITENQIENNGDNGIWLYEFRDNTISRNKIEGNNASGIDLLYYSWNNLIFQNNITSNTKYGIYQHKYSGQNLIYHNNFMENNNQAINHAETAPSIWDNGSIGNFWSDYLVKYPNAKEIDTSGIGNTPYVIDQNNTDNYPLMNPITDTGFPSSSQSPIPTPTLEPSISPTPDTVPYQEPFPTTLVIVASAIVAVVGIVSLVYFKKLRSEDKPS